MINIDSIKSEFPDCRVYENGNGIYFLITSSPEFPDKVAALVDVKCRLKSLGFQLVVYDVEHDCITGCLTNA